MDNIGALWRTAETACSARQLAVSLSAKGATIESVQQQRGSTVHDIFFSLPKDKALDICGYLVDSSEWLEEENHV